MKKNIKNGSRYCPFCETKLIKWGKQSKKYQRWHCTVCKKTFDLGKEKRKELERIKALKLMFEYVLKQKTKSDLRNELNLSYYKLTKAINSVIDVDVSIPRNPGPYKVIYIDGIRFKSFAVLIARDNDNVVDYDFVESENAQTWEKFLSRFIPSEYVVCDGQKGLLKAIKNVWHCTKVQRCLFHVWANIRQKLTLNPETQAGIELLKIARKLLKITSIEEKENWLKLYKDWSEKYNAFLLEQTVNSITGEVTWKHERIKSAVYNLDKLILNDNLFRYLEVDFVSAYNNLLEGGINSPLRHLIGVHRGATLKLRKAIIKCYLLKRSKYWKIVTNKLYKNKNN